jgi:TolB protein
MVLGPPPPSRSAPDNIGVLERSTASALRLEKVGGDEQTDTVVATLASPLKVLVMRGSSPARGIPVLWTANSGAVSEEETSTDGAGIASVRWTLGARAGDQYLYAWVSGAAGSPLRFRAQAAPPAIVTDPLPSPAPRTRAGDGSRPSSPGSQVVYVSLAPATIPNGVTATIRSSLTGSSLAAVMVEGGFDPVPVPMDAGDTLAIEVQVSGSDAPLSFTQVAPGSRRPRVVRTDPAPRTRDVPLNWSPRIVFSEPIDPGSLTAESVQLRRGAELVPGRLTFLDEHRLVAAFVAQQPLASRTEYHLLITQEIRDGAGEALEAPIHVAFTTGSAPAEPLRGRIAYVVGSGIVVMNADGSERRLIRPLPRNDALQWDRLAWSPDGARLAFQEDGRLFVGNADGTGLTPLTSGHRDDYAPAWSPDGGRIAFASHRGSRDRSNASIYVMNADGSAVTRLTRGKGGVGRYDWFPTWSPDGTKLAFARYPSGLHVMNADGSQHAHVLRDWRQVFGLAWSPDGSRIAFSEFAGCCESIFVVNADGSGLRRLTSGLWEDHDPAWSPDGSRIVFTRNSVLYVMNADGSEVRSLGGLGHLPAWSSGEREALAGRAGPGGQADTVGAKPWL